MTPNQSDRSALSAALEDSKWAGAAIGRECERQALKVYEFSEFRELTPQHILDPKLPHPKYPNLAQNPNYIVMRQAIMLMKKRMAHMNKQDRAIPNDSIESLLDKMTRKSSKVAVVLDNILAANSPLHVSGFALGIKNPADVPDFDDVPDKLKQGPFMRLLRFVVDPDCKRFGAHGAVAAKLLEGVDIMAEGDPIVAMFLLAHFPQDKTLHPIWREARDFFIGAPGSERAKHPHFEDADQAHIQTFKHADGQETILRFGWFVRNLSSEAMQKAHQAYQAYYRKRAVGAQRVS